MIRAARKNVAWALGGVLRLELRSKLTHVSRFLIRSFLLIRALRTVCSCQKSYLFRTSLINHKSSMALLLRSLSSTSPYSSDLNPRLLFAKSIPCRPKPLLTFHPARKIEIESWRNNSSKRDFVSKHFELIHLAGLRVLKHFSKHKSSFLSSRFISISLHFLLIP